MDNQLSEHIGRSFCRYILTGSIAAVIDIGGFALLGELHLPVALAAALSFLTSTIVNFDLTSRWVFHTSPSFKRYLVFLLGSMLGALTNVTLTFVAVALLGFPQIVAKTSAVAGTFSFNFLINVFVVFRTARANQKPGTPPITTVQKKCLVTANVRK